MILQEGIEIKSNCEIGVTISGKEVMDQFDAICLAIGSMQPRDLKVEGRELDGIHFAMDFLTQQNRINQGTYISYYNRITAKGRNVLVIGGGDTGSDCVGTAIRQGARSVMQIEILPEPPEKRSLDNPWPYFARTLKTTTSHEEGCIRKWNLSAIKFTGMQKRIMTAVVEEVKWEMRNGNYTMQTIPGTVHHIDTDLVLLAMGFLHPVHEGLLAELGVELNERENIKTNDNMCTNIHKVFAAGDAISGASLVVNAIASGRKVAKQIERFLKTK